MGCCARNQSMSEKNGIPKWLEMNTSQTNNYSSISLTHSIVPHMSQSLKNGSDVLGRRWLFRHFDFFLKEKRIRHHYKDHVVPLLQKGWGEEVIVLYYPGLLGPLSPSRKLLTR